MIKVIHNSLGSGDWVLVMRGEETLFSGHRITPDDMVDILASLGCEAAKVDISDEEMESGDF